MNDTTLRRFLERVADLTIVGLLTLVASLAVVTGLAALTAAATTLGSTGSGSLPVRYLHAFRSSLRPTLRPQLLLLAALAVGGSDLAVGLWWIADPHQSPWLTAAVLACGVLLLGGAVTLPPYLATLPALNGGRRALVRDAAALAYGRPGHSIMIAATGAVLIAAGLALPALTPVLVGTYVLVSLTAVSSAAPRHRAAHKPAVRSDECWLAVAPLR